MNEKLFNLLKFKNNLRNRKYEFEIIEYDN